MNILQITALLCITQLAISTATPPRYRYRTPEEAEERSPILGDGEKLYVIVIIKILSVRHDNSVQSMRTEIIQDGAV